MTRSSLAWGAIPGMRASSRSRSGAARALELLREALHLGQQESPLQLGQAQIEAHRLVLIPGPVRDAPHVGQRPGPLRHGPVVAEDDPALAGVEVLAGLEGEGAGVADGSYPPPPPGASRGPGRVLHHLQPVATGDGRHGVQVRRLAGDVHGDDGPRARSHPRPASASIRYVSGRMSQKTGMAPMASTAVAVATKV